jgi:hypothetical protein
VNYAIRFRAFIVSALVVATAWPTLARADDVTIVAPAVAAQASPAAQESQAAPTAQDQAAVQAAIIKASQNPVGNIAIIPFQNNFNYGVGPYARLQYNLNLQPVVPIMLNQNLNLIARIITPINNNPSSAPPEVCASAFGCPGTFGIGDLNPQFFFAPKTKPGALIWGVGPQMLFPSATPATLGAGKYGLGPALVGLIMPGDIVTGALVTQVWSIGGDPTRPDVSSILIQPFFNYNLKGGWTLTTAPQMTANWNATPQQGKWTVQVGGGVSRTFKLGPDPMQLGLYYYGNVVRATNAPYGQIRFQWSLLFPVKRGIQSP